MLKIFAAFIAFAALALFVILKAGDKVDMAGESAGHGATEATAPAAPAPSPAPASK